MFPSRSTTLRYVVSPPGGRSPAAGSQLACCALTSLARCRAQSFDNSVATGNFCPRGSPMYFAKSAYASFFASIIVCSAFGVPNWLHTMIEAKKLAYADLAKYIGDPRGQKLPVATLLSKDWARQRARLVNAQQANCEPAAGDLPPGGDTTYLSVVDREGNMVSLIQSNYSEFGSGIVAEGTGFALQNRGGLFSLDRNSPNALAGHKRPLHTIIPAFAEKGETRIAFGIMGGWNQSQAHAQFIADVVDFKMNIQAALEAPRFTKLDFSGCDVEMENRFSGKVREELAARGHRIEWKGAYTSDVGGGQAVMRDFATGVNYGASDPRKDGQAAPEMPLQ